MSRQLTLEEIAQHNKPDDCWIIIGGKVYDVTKFLSEHPGGKKVLLNVAGKDATKQFESLHKPETLKKYGPPLLIGELVGNRSVPASGGNESQTQSSPDSLQQTPIPSSSTHCILQKLSRR
jgi:cytochrome b involved in lipid metabolism